MNELAQAFAKAGGAKNAARQRLAKAVTQEAREAALIALGLADIDYKRAQNLANEKSLATRRSAKPSKKDRIINDLCQELFRKDQAVALVREGLVLAETEDSLVDWMDSARDYLEEIDDCCRTD